MDETKPFPVSRLSAATGSIITAREKRRLNYAFSGIAGDSRTVSFGSPVGQALLGRQVGETVIVQLPDGRLEPLEILAVSPLAEAA